MVFSANMARASMSSGYFTQSVSRILRAGAAIAAIDVSRAEGIGQQVRRQRVDIKLFAGTGLALSLDRLADHVRPRPGRPNRAACRARQSPVGHGVLGLQFQAPTKGALGLVVPEGMEQRIALVEPALYLGILRRDGKMRHANACDRPRLLARSGVKGLAVLGMTQLRENAGVRRWKRGQRQGQAEECCDAQMGNSRHARIPSYVNWSSIEQGFDITGLMFKLPACWVLCAALGFAQPVANRQVKQLKVTILSTMLADDGIGEWGFAALVEADSRTFLVDTGARPETVLSNLRDLKIDLSQVRDVVLTHFHSDHTGGLMTLRTEMKKRNTEALSRVHAATGIFYSRPMQGGGEGNPMIAVRSQYQASGGQFVEHDRATEILPGVWLTGPVARKFPERNWSGSGRCARRPG